MPEELKFDSPAGGPTAGSTSGPFDEAAPDSVPGVVANPEGIAGSKRARRARVAKKGETSAEELSQFLSLIRGQLEDESTVAPVEVLTENFAYAEVVLAPSSSKRLLQDAEKAFRELKERDFMFLDSSWLRDPVFLKLLYPNVRQPLAGCGNEGCDADISEVDRSVLICPVCDNAILSRCGNANCTGFLSPETSALHSCPVCHQLNRCRYWSCGNHGGIEKILSSQESYCHYCAKELLAKLTPDSNVDLWDFQVSLRPNVAQAVQKVCSECESSRASRRRRAPRWYEHLRTLPVSNNVARDIVEFFETRWASCSEDGCLAAWEKGEDEV